MNALARNENFDVGHDQFSIEKNTKLIHAIAGRTLKIFESIGIDYMEYDDVFQLALITFNHAASKFDRQSGNRFSTYYIAAMKNESKKVIHNHMRNVKTTSVEELSGEDGNSIYDIIPSEDATPEDVCEMKEHALEVISKLSVRARLVVRCLVRPRISLRKAFKEREDYAAECHKQGIRTSFPKELDVNFIAQYYGFSRRETDKIKEELRKAVGDNTLWHYKK